MNAEDLLDAVRRAKRRADARVESASHADGLVAEAASWALSLLYDELEDEIEKSNRSATAESEDADVR